MDNNWQYIIGIIVMIYSSPLFYDIVKKYINTKFPGKEEKKIELESTKIGSESRKADAETITEKATADKIYVDTANSLMDAQKQLFDQRVALVEKRQLESNELAEKRQIETAEILAKITKQNTEIKEQNQKLTNENYEIHQENQKLTQTITKLQSIIIELKNLIKKLMGGINKLVKAYEEDHKDGILPWKPILTEREQILLQSDDLEKT